MGLRSFSFPGKTGVSRCFRWTAIPICGRCALPRRISNPIVNCWEVPDERQRSLGAVAGTPPQSAEAADGPAGLCQPGDGLQPGPLQLSAISVAAGGTGVD